MNSGILELKLQKVHFPMANLAEENFSSKCTACGFNPIVKKKVDKYPNGKLTRRGLLCLVLLQ